MPASGVWEIRDKTGALLFAGELWQCEDWLDLNENTQRAPVELVLSRDQPPSLSSDISEAASPPPEATPE